MRNVWKTVKFIVQRKKQNDKNADGKRKGNFIVLFFNFLIFLIY